MHLVASVRPDVCLCYDDCLCVCNQWAFAGNCADVVNRLLM